MWKNTVAIHSILKKKLQNKIFNQLNIKKVKSPKIILKKINEKNKKMRKLEKNEKGEKKGIHCLLKNEKVKKKRIHCLLLHWGVGEQ
jgi:DNA-directed RNA polymerase subunit H (RpoH/RPB5)